MAGKHTPSKDQQWRTQKGTFYAINRQRELAYRRMNEGPWEQTELLSKDALGGAEVVGWDKIDTLWFTVYRARVT